MLRIIIFLCAMYVYCIPYKLPGCDYKILQNYFYVTGIGYFLVFEVLDWMVMSNRSFLGGGHIGFGFSKHKFPRLVTSSRDLHVTCLNPNLNSPN